jgi:hypothetical protein
MTIAQKKPESVKNSGRVKTVIPLLGEQHVARVLDRLGHGALMLR